MLPLHEVELFLQQTPPHFQEIVLELRNIIVSVAPDAVEVVRWGGLNYFHAGGGIVSAGICQIGIHDRHIRLAFIHGAFLSDPRHLLEGDQRYKRYIRIPSYDDAPWEDLKQMIQASAQFDPRSIQPV
ncbi:MAG: DUF1801 domain-containing protein [Anaerolineales bacterium]|nr:DUF1801 domain-containing protein [Anaerolineales bacterium]